MTRKDWGYVLVCVALVVLTAFIPGWTGVYL